MLNDGKEESVHVRNTGRLKELLVSGAAATLQQADAPNRKTAYDLIFVYKPDLEGVNIDRVCSGFFRRGVLKVQR